MIRMHKPYYMAADDWRIDGAYVIYCGNHVTPSWCDWMVPGTWVEEF